MFYLKSFAMWAICILTTAGVVLAQSEKPSASTDPEPPAGIKVIKEPEVLESPARDVSRNDERYKIGYEDVLNINVYRHPELSQTVTVGHDGTILMPRIDTPILAICKTERELSSLISALYEDYLRRPFVSVRAIEIRSQPFAVVGAVTKPGSYYMNRRVRLLELIAIAGGPDLERSGSTIQVARVGNVSGCKAEDTPEDEVEFFSYAVRDVLKGTANPVMEPGDIISVLEADEAYVVGNVDKPTVILLKEPITLTQAIAKAGGMSDVAKTSRVVIQRREPGSVLKTELVFDLREIREQKVPDPVLQANDIVEVPTDNKKVIRNGLLKVLTGGIGNLFYRIPL